MELLSIRALLEKYEEEVSDLLSQRVSENTLKEYVKTYKSYAVAVAHAIDLSNPEIEKWSEESIANAVAYMRSQLTQLGEDRDTKRGLKDLFDLFKKSTKRFERLWIRNHEDKSKNTALGAAESKESGMFGRLLNLFTNSGEKAANAGSVDSHGQTTYISTSSEDGTNVDETTPYHRQVQSDSTYIDRKFSKVDISEISKAKSDSNVNEQAYSDSDLEPITPEGGMDIHTTKDEQHLPPNIGDSPIIVQRSASDTVLRPSPADHGNISAERDAFLSPNVPVIRLSKTLTEKSFSSDGSCQFLPGGKPNCTRHKHKYNELKRAKSDSSAKSYKDYGVAPSAVSQENVRGEGHKLTPFKSDEDNSQTIRDNTDTEKSWQQLFNQSAEILQSKMMPAETFRPQTSGNPLRQKMFGYTIRQDQPQFECTSTQATDPSAKSWGQMYKTGTDVMPERRKDMYMTSFPPPPPYSDLSKHGCDSQPVEKQQLWDHTAPVNASTPNHSLLQCDQEEIASSHGIGAEDISPVDNMAREEDNEGSQQAPMQGVTGSSPNLNSFGSCVYPTEPMSEESADGEQAAMSFPVQRRQDVQHSGTCESCPGVYSRNINYTPGPVPEGDICQRELATVHSEGPLMIPEYLQRQFQQVIGLCKPDSNATISTGVSLQATTAGDQVDLEDIELVNRERERQHKLMYEDGIQIQPCPPTLTTSVEAQQKVREWFGSNDQRKQPTHFCSGFCEGDDEAERMKYVEEGERVAAVEASSDTNLSGVTEAGCQVEHGGRLLAANVGTYQQRVGYVHEHQRVAGGCQSFGVTDMNSLQQSLREQFTKTERYLKDKSYISDCDDDQDGYFNPLATKMRLMGQVCKADELEGTSVDISMRDNVDVNLKQYTVRSTHSSYKYLDGCQISESSGGLSLPTVCVKEDMKSGMNETFSKPTIDLSAMNDSLQTEKMSASEETVECVSTNPRDVNHTDKLTEFFNQELESNDQEMKVGLLEMEVKRLQGILEISELNCEQVMKENERYKTKYQAEMAANEIIADKLDCSEIRMNKLQNSLLQAQNQLAAVEMELGILKDPAAKRIRENQGLETQLQEALDEKQKVLGQMKNVEKLLEEVMVEKDELATANCEMKTQNNQLKRDNERLRVKVNDLEISTQDMMKKEKILDKQVFDLREKLLEYQRSQSQVQKQRDEMAVALDDLTAAKEDLEENDLKQQQEIRVLKGRLVRFDNEVLRWEDKIATTHESQAEEIDNWKELVRQSEKKASDAKNNLKSAEKELEKAKTKWTEETTQLQTELVECKAALTAAEKEISNLQQQNEGMAIAINEQLPLELLESKTALENQKEAVKRLTDENLALLQALNESSPTCELEEKASALEKAEQDIKDLKTHSSEMISSLRSDLQEELNKANNATMKEKEKVENLFKENERLSKMVFDNHPQEIGRLTDQLQSKEKVIQSLRQQNEDLLYTLTEQAEKMRERQKQHQHDIGKQRQSVARLLREAEECNRLNDPAACCADCRRRGAAIARLCHKMCLYLEMERERAKALKEELKDSEISDINSDSTTELMFSQVEATVEGTEVGQRLKPEQIPLELQALRNEVRYLKTLLQMEISGVNIEEYIKKPDIVEELQDQVKKQMRENAWLKEGLQDAVAKYETLEKDAVSKLEEVKSKHSGILKRVNVSITQSKTTLERGRVSKLSSKGDEEVPEQFIKEVSRSEREEKDVDTTTLDANGEVSEKPGRKSTSTRASGAGAEEILSRVNKERKSTSEGTQAKEESEEKVVRKLTVAESLFEDLHQNVEDKIKLIELLTEQNDALNAEVETLTAALQQPTPAVHPATEEMESANKKIRKLSLELDITGRQLKSCQRELEACGRGENKEASVAYIVRQREEEIRSLKEKVAELQRTIVAQNKVVPCDAVMVSKKKSKSSPGKGSKLDMSEHQQSGTVVSSSMISILMEDSQRLKDIEKKLRIENELYNRTLKEKEALLVEMARTIKHYEMYMNTLSDPKEKGLAGFPKKLKEGESELSKLQVQIAWLKEKRKSLTAENQEESLAERTQYAHRLSQLIRDCVKDEECSNVEMLKLCDKLDEVESLKVDLEEQIKELHMLKTDVIPKLQADVETARLEYDDTKVELDNLQTKLKEAELKCKMVEYDKDQLEEKYNTEMRQMEMEKDGGKTELGIAQAKSKAAINERESKLVQVQKELNEALATAKEKEGSAIHWKLQHDNKSRELKDELEKHELAMRIKDQELQRVKDSYHDLQKELAYASAPGEEKMANINRQLKDIQQKHLEVINRTKSSDRISGDNISRLYTELGEVNVGLQRIIRDREREIQRVKNDLEKIEKERETFQEECAKMIQDKQIEIRRLSNDMERMELEGARLNAVKEKEITKLKEDLKQKVDKAHAEKAHMNASKGSEISKLRLETDKLIANQRRDAKTISELRELIKKLELDKGQLTVLKDSLQTDNERHKKELDKCRHDKKYFERMVDRLNTEMETRVAAVRQDSTKALQIKDEHTTELYGKMEKIARERGNLSTELYTMLQDRDNKIEELTAKVQEYVNVSDKTENEYRSRLEKKTKEVKTLRSEIKRMGVEGMKLLEQREKEILEMRGHLKKVLKVMETKARQLSKDSDTLLSRKTTESGVSTKSMPPKQVKSALGTTNAFQLSRSQKSAAVKQTPSKKTFKNSK